MNQDVCIEIFNTHPRDENAYLLAKIYQSWSLKYLYSLKANDVIPISLYLDSKPIVDCYCKIIDTPEKTQCSYIIRVVNAN